MIATPSGLTPTQRRLWRRAVFLQAGDPALPVGIVSLVRGTDIPRRKALALVLLLEPRGLWPFPRPGRSGGGRHATARYGCGSRHRAVGKLIGGEVVKGRKYLREASES